MDDQIRGEPARRYIQLRERLTYESYNLIPDQDPFWESAKDNPELQEQRTRDRLKAIAESKRLTVYAESNIVFHGLLDPSDLSGYETIDFVRTQSDGKPDSQESYDLLRIKIAEHALGKYDYVSVRRHEKVGSDIVAHCTGFRRRSCVGK
jgi:hypothetical protein